MADREIHHHHAKGRGGAGNALYGLGIFGAAVYYVQASTGFWGGVLGLLKALVWPAMLVYRVFDMLKM